MVNGETHPEYLNTPRLIADSLGTPVWRWDQAEPFGVNGPTEDPSSLGAFEFPLRFPGQYADRETGQNYNYFRDCYAPETGRYCESDPIGLAGGLNPYAYVASAVIQKVDPLGLALPSQEPPKDPRMISGPYDAPPRPVDKWLDRIGDFVLKQLTGLGGLVTGKPIAFGIPLLLHSSRLNENEHEEILKMKRQNSMCTP